MSRKSVGYK